MKTRRSRHMIRAWLVNRSWLVVSSLALIVVTSSGALGVVGSDEEPIPVHAASAHAASARAAAVDTAPIPMPPIPDSCENGATEPFAPTSIDIQDVRTELPILALARDGNDVPGVPPVTAADAVAWDRPPRGLPPGSSGGNVLLNAHTSPDETALGNAMLENVDVGDVIRLRNGETHLCYRVTKRVEVSVYEEYEPFYAEDGPPQFAFIVCSGERLGPGEWTKRTLWFGSPIGTGPRMFLSGSTEPPAHSPSWKPQSQAASWMSERSLLENRLQTLDNLLATKLGANMVEETESQSMPQAEARRKAERIWPFWALD